MTAARIAAALALLLALSGWGLYKQIAANGEYRQKLEQIAQDLLREKGVSESLRNEIAARDEATKLLEAQYDDLRTKAAQVRTVIRTVYVQPDVQAWADTAPPPAVVDAVGAGIGCLWQSAASGGNADCGAVAAGGNDGGLPAP